MSLQFTLHQTQKLYMTPELKQSLLILQMSSSELEDFLNEQCSENPLIDRVDSHTIQRKPNNYNPDWWLNKNTDSGNTLTEHLMEQLQMLQTDHQVFKVCKFIIENMDERGYLAVSPKWITDQSGVEPSIAAEALQLVRGLEPAGVGAFTLSDCLLLQIERSNIRDDLIKQLVSGHLNDIAKGRLMFLARLYNTEVVDIERAVAQIRKLHPHPGSVFGRSSTQYLHADLEVGLHNGKIIISVEEKMTPRLVCNASYLKLLNQSSGGEAKYFLENRWMTALWITKCIEQRRMTVQRVAEAIFAEQEQFLHAGSQYIRSFSMKQIADRLNIHESTVSRAVNGKFAQTPWGIYELRYFFVSGLESANGELMSANELKKKIVNMIKNEDSRKPLSDQKIMEHLKKEGIEIARRTVAKYRDEMEIPSMINRKRFRY